MVSRFKQIDFLLFIRHVAQEYNYIYVSKSKLKSKLIQ
jgi:hypothetical protein